MASRNTSLGLDVRIEKAQIMMICISSNSLAIDAGRFYRKNRKNCQARRASDEIKLYQFNWLIISRAIDKGFWKLATENSTIEQKALIYHWYFGKEERINRDDRQVIKLDHN